MSTRWRIFLAAVVLIVLPAGLLAGLFRQRLLDLGTRAFEQETTRSLGRAIAGSGRWARQHQDQLDRLAEAAVDDNRLRLALVGDRDDLKPYLRDYASRVARTTRLDVLQLMDADGAILSSAHLRNEFGRREPELLAALGESGSLCTQISSRTTGVDVTAYTDFSLVRHDTLTAFSVDRDATGSFLALIGRRDFAVGAATFHWVGGRRIADLSFGNAATGLVTADTTIAPLGTTTDLPPMTQDQLDAWGRESARRWAASTVPVFLDGRLRSALLVAAVDEAPLTAQRRRLDELIAVTFAAILTGAFLLAAWWSGRLSRPLAALAARADEIDLDHPTSRFDSTRTDEVGRLGSVLDAMLQRLRSDARRRADLERQATLGEVSRQVNHDLRNGITPVRNVVRHLGEIAAEDPDRLAEVFAARHGTLEHGLDHLDELAGQYARLAPVRRRESCDLGVIARDAAAGYQSVAVEVADDVPPVLADRVSLRRIIDNLLRNALDALPAGRGHVAITVKASVDPDLGSQCVLTVRDDGVGMSDSVRARVCEDFFTTKEGGTGLGLSNVRRLAGDAGAQLAIDSEPGQGTTVTVTFPAVEDDQ